MRPRAAPFPAYRKGEANTHALLVEADKRLTGLVSLPRRRALRIAEQFGVSAYDARFLGAAQSFKTRPVTEDARLRQAAPALRYRFPKPSLRDSGSGMAMRAAGVKLQQDTFCSEAWP